MTCATCDYQPIGAKPEGWRCATCDPARLSERGEQRELRKMIAEARRDVREDDDYWARLACGQDTEEAEESGRLAGYAEGLEAALKLLES
jgi:hypothetical protein